MTTAIIAQYQNRIDSLKVPSLYDNDPLTLSPYVFKLELTTIRSDLLKLINSTKTPTPQLLKLLNILEEKEYVVNKQWQRVQEESKQDEVSGDDTSTDDVISDIKDDTDTNPLADTNETLLSLRQRLLSKDKSILDDPKSTVRTNDYHESIQQDMFNELLDLALVLKSTTLNFSNALMGEDKDMISATSNQLSANADTMDRVGSNLNNYVSNKLGSKISLFWMIKIALVLFVVFVFILIIAKLLPSM